MPTIALIGAGNLAWHLGQALYGAGNTISEVFSKNLENAQALAALFPDAIPTHHLNFAESKAQVFIVAVKDDALASVLEELVLPPQAILAHTSGTQSLQLIRNQAISPAVFYPLQTFSKAKQVNFTAIPICIEASNEATYLILEQIAQSISTQVYRLSSEQRQVLHLAAVFACNFPNFLFLISKQILAQQQIPFDLLKPLIDETVEKAFSISPENAQTGPAKRGDNSIIDKHLALLNSLEINPDWQKIYQLLSKNITDYFVKNKH